MSILLKKSKPLEKAGTSSASFVVIAENSWIQGVSQNMTEKCFAALATEKTSAQKGMDLEGDLGL